MRFHSPCDRNTYTKAQSNHEHRRHSANTRWKSFENANTWTDSLLSRGGSSCPVRRLSSRACDRRKLTCLAICTQNGPWSRHTGNLTWQSPMRHPISDETPEHRMSFGTSAQVAMLQLVSWLQCTCAYSRPRLDASSLTCCVDSPAGPAAFIASCTVCHCCTVICRPEAQFCLPFTCGRSSSNAAGAQVPHAGHCR
jgi:hypothetical protein